MSDLEKKYQKACDNYQAIKAKVPQLLMDMDMLLKWAFKRDPTLKSKMECHKECSDRGRWHKIGSLYNGDLYQDILKNQAKQK